LEGGVYLNNIQRKISAAVEVNN